MVRSYQLHANAYIAKPTTFDLFTEAIRQVTGLFLSLASLPQIQDPPGCDGWRVRLTRQRGT